MKPEIIDVVDPPRHPDPLRFPVLEAHEHGMLREAPWAEPFMDTLIDVYFPGCERGLTLVSLVTPGQTIPEHADQHDGGCRRRVHIPLVTDPACKFLTCGEAVHMKLGFAWLIDPTVPHSVEHRGIRDRIHLMFNVKG